MLLWTSFSKVLSDIVVVVRATKLSFDQVPSVKRKKDNKSVCLFTILALKLCVCRYCSLHVCSNIKFMLLEFVYVTFIFIILWLTLVKISCYTAHLMSGGHAL